MTAALSAFFEMALFAADPFQGVGYSGRPPAGAPFVAEFRAETRGDGPIRSQRIRVLRDREGRQRIEEFVSEHPPIWMIVVHDWVARRIFATMTGADAGPTEVRYLPPKGAEHGDLQWEMGMLEGDWNHAPIESEESIDGFDCKRMEWRRPDGGRLTVWVAAELGYPIRQEFVLPGLSKTIRMVRISREDPAPSLFQP